MSTLTPNADLAYQVLDHIDAHPNSWNQNTWLLTHEPEQLVTAASCGTVACFAGWTVLLAGNTATFDCVIEDYVVNDVAIPVQAQRLLGLNSSEAESLFHPDNSRAELGDIVAEAFGPRPTGGAA